MMKRLLLLLACACLGLSARAAELGDSLWGPSGFGPAAAPRSDSVDFQLRDTPASSAPDPEILDARLRAGFIVSRSTSDTWSVRQSAGLFRLSQAPILPQGLSVPRDLWDVDTGAGCQHRMGERRSWGVTAGVGSASDQLYHGIHETTFHVTGDYQIPSRDKNSWLFFLSYSNNRHFANNVPLPGVAYQLRAPERGLEAMIGLPFLAVSYKPAPRWSGRLSVFGPENVSAEWAYLLAGPVQTYVGYDWSQREWLPVGRPDRGTRLFYDEKRWSLGLRSPIWKGLRADLAACYGFDRRMYEAVRAVSTGVQDVEFAAAWSLQARAGVRW